MARRKQKSDSSGRKYIAVEADAFDAHLAIKAKIAEAKGVRELTWTDYLRILASENLKDLQEGEK